MKTVWKYISIILKGIIIGFISVAIPGLSASTIAIVFGIYYLLIDSISSLFTKFTKSIVFLASLILGYSIGSFLGSSIITVLYNKFPLPVILLILGFVLGSLPQMFKEVRVTKVKKINWIIPVVVVAALVCYSIFAFNGEPISFSDMKVYDYIILGAVGLITSATLVVPGVDFAMVLLSLGYYYAIIGVISDIFNFANIVHNLSILGTYLLGYSVGAFLFSVLIKKLFMRFNTQMKFANIGFVLAAPFVVIKNCIIENPNFYYSVNQTIVGSILFVVSFIAMMAFYHFTDKNDTREKVRQKRHQLRFYSSFMLHPFKGLRLIKLFKKYEKDKTRTFEENYKFVVESVTTINRCSNAYPVGYGLENIPDVPCIYAANHQGKFDALGLLEVLKDHPTSAIVDVAMTNHPLYKQAIGLLELKLLDRTSLREELMAVKEMGQDIVEKNRSYIVFPEGWYEDNHNRLLEFNAGFMKAAEIAKCPIVPVCLYDTWKVYGISSLKKIYPRYEILKPISYEEYGALSRYEAAQLIKSRIQEKIDELDNLSKEIETNEVFTN